MSVTFQGKLRDKLGSRGARKLRAQGQVPCNIQGGAGAHVNFSIDEHAFFTARRQHEHLFDIELGDATETALVRELQWDALGENLLHIEFRRVVRGQETESEVTLEFVGQSKEGIVQHLLERVTVAAIPTKIPEFIEVRVDGLEVGHPLLASQLALPEGVRLVSDPRAPVALVAEAKGEAPAEEGEEEFGAEGGAPESSAPEA